LLETGAIDYDQFVQVYEQAGKPLTEEQIQILTEGSDAPIVFDQANAYFLLNFFWAFGLTNQNALLDEGPMMNYGADRIGNLASTGGWSIGAFPVMELYSSAAIVPLTAAQQEQARRRMVYRPAVTITAFRLQSAWRCWGCWR
jgi:hypothetical protein